MLNMLLTQKRFKFKRSHLIKSDLDTVWDFFTSTNAILKLTPDHMQLAIISKNLPEKIYQGMQMELWLTPIFKIPFKWQTEIIDICAKEEFTDVQVSGPFSYWKHRHIFTETSVGILVEDEIDYEVPIPILGEVLNRITIYDDLTELFDFREQQLNKIFNNK